MIEYDLLCTSQLPCRLIYRALILWSYGWDVAKDDIYDEQCWQQRVHRLLILICASVSRVLYVCKTCMDPGYGLVCACPWVCAGFPKPVSIIVKKLVRLSLSSGRLLSHSNQIYCVFSSLPLLCTFSFFKLILTNKLIKIK